MNIPGEAYGGTTMRVTAGLTAAAAALAFGGFSANTESEEQYPHRAEVAATSIDTAQALGNTALTAAEVPTAMSCTKDVVLTFTTGVGQVEIKGSRDRCEGTKSVDEVDFIPKKGTQPDGAAVSLLATNGDYLGWGTDDELGSYWRNPTTKGLKSIHETLPAEQIYVTVATVGSCIGSNSHRVCRASGIRNFEFPATTTTKKLSTFWVSNPRR